MSNVSIALLRLSVTKIAVAGGAGRPVRTNTSYVRVVASRNGTKLVSIDELGADGGEFLAALADQKARWDPFLMNGAVPHLPDTRYADTAVSLLTMYMNADKGLVPDYGMGQFWNDYNTFIPLDTSAIGGALLEWGQPGEALRYIGHYFAIYVNNQTGAIKYGIFGCELVDSAAAAARATLLVLLLILMLVLPLNLPALSSQQ